MTEIATFGAGCFWSPEKDFRQLQGVVDVISGYSGGTVDNPTYKQVCTGKTGHAEAVQVTFDPAHITYEKLINTFWEMHNPTHVNRQGVNIGHEYRSVIFYHSPEQQKIAETSKKNLELSGKYKKPIATEITEASTFWKAEEYHQRFLEKHPWVFCHF